MRGIKRSDTPILKGLQIYHNFVRPHEALNGETPANREQPRLHRKGKPGEQPRTTQNHPTKNPRIERPGVRFPSGPHSLEVGSRHFFISSGLQCVSNLTQVGVRNLTLLWALRLLGGRIPAGA